MYWWNGIEWYRTLCSISSGENYINGNPILDLLPCKVGLTCSNKSLGNLSLYLSPLWETASTRISSWLSLPLAQQFQQKSLVASEWPPVLVLSLSCNQDHQEMSCSRQAALSHLPLLCLGLSEGINSASVSALSAADRAPCIITDPSHS